MGLFSDWNMKQKPTGAWRSILRAPIHLYRWRLGFLFGERLLMVTHRGRVTGAIHRTVVEVVEHDPEMSEYIVCSGTGPAADWYLNLVASPATEIQVRNRRWTPDQRLLDDDEAARRFAGYERRHPKAARRLLQTMGNSYDGTDSGRLEMMAEMPMIAFSDDDRRATAATSAEPT